MGERREREQGGGKRSIMHFSFSFRIFSKLVQLVKKVFVVTTVGRFCSLCPHCTQMNPPKEPKPSNRSWHFQTRFLRKKKHVTQILFEKQRLIKCDSKSVCAFLKALFIFLHAGVSQKKIITTQLGKSRANKYTTAKSLCSSTTKFAGN